MSLNIISTAILFVFLLLNPCMGQLSSTFYDTTCPTALTTIRTVIRKAVTSDRRMAASLIRLQFHDCFVQGCDASLLLDQTSTFGTEKTTLANDGVRGYNVIEDAKTEVEKICPNVVSCADILAVAARDASDLVGGPTWTVNLGRRDSTTAYPSLATPNNIPTPFDSLSSLIELFDRKGLNTREMVALSGSHTIGKSQCRAFRRRIYNGTNIDPGFASTRQLRCPSVAPEGDRNLAPLDLVTPDSFDNNYFKNLIQLKGLLESDQVLFNGGSTTRSIVEEYSKKPEIFSSDFASAMIKMGDISPLTGKSGIIRRICSAIN